MTNRRPNVLRTPQITHIHAADSQQCTILTVPYRQMSTNQPRAAALCTDSYLFYLYMHVLPRTTHRTFRGVRLIKIIFRPARDCCGPGVVPSVRNELWFGATSDRAVFELPLTMTVSEGTSVCRRCKGALLYLRFPYVSTMSWMWWEVIFESLWQITDSIENQRSSFCNNLT